VEAPLSFDLSCVRLFAGFQRNKNGLTVYFLFSILEDKADKSVPGT
jgi:hypothetical protein